MVGIKPQGFNLIEIMVALMLVSIVLLSFQNLERLAIHRSRNAYLKAVAIIQVTNIVQRLIAHKDVENQLYIWNQENKEVLPNGHGTIQGEFPNYEITISWGNPTAQKKNIICFRTQV